jgi:hypothetical protein
VASLPNGLSSEPVHWAHPHPAVDAYLRSSLSMNATCSNFTGTDCTVLIAVPAPRHFRECRSIRPRVNSVIFDRLDCNVVSQNHFQRVSVGGARAADRFPVLVIGGERDSIEIGLYLKWG